MLTITRYAIDECQCTLVLHGDLDLQTVPQLRTCIADALSQRPNDVTLDLGGLEFCDAAGITAFLCARQAVAAIGAQFRIRPAYGQVAHILFLTGVDLCFGLDRPSVERPEHVPDIRDVVAAALEA